MSKKSHHSQKSAINIPKYYGNVSTSPLYYVSTDEGLLSHYRQLDIVWNSVKYFNRSIVAVPFSSYHYPKIDQISMCSIFRLPNEITCIKSDNISILMKKKCIYTGVNHHYSHYYNITFEIPMETNRNFSYLMAECVAGGINLDVGYPGPLQRKNMMKYPIFQNKYTQFLPIIRNILGLSEESQYIVAHWRRGDQLFLKCTDKLTATGRERIARRERKREDHSINCGNVTDFVKRLNEDITQNIAITNLPMITYIATNEKDPIILQYLKQRGYYLLSDIKSSLTKSNYKLNALDDFVLELLLICDATYFFAWGDSGSHNFFYHCRMIDEYRKHVTIMDDPRSLGHGHHINNYGKQYKTKVIKPLTVV